LIAAQNGHLEVVKYLLAKDGIEVNKADNDGDTPLYVAAQNDHVNIGAILLIHGANFDGAHISNFSEFYDNAINYIAQGIIDYDEYRLKELAFAMGDHSRLGVGSEVRTIDDDTIKTILDLAAPPKIELNKMQQQHRDAVQLRIDELQQEKNTTPASNFSVRDNTSSFQPGSEQGHVA
jgi:ankyrin repeat protein